MDQDMNNFISDTKLIEEVRKQNFQVSDEFHFKFKLYFIIFCIHIILYLLCLYFFIICIKRANSRNCVNITAIS